MALANLAHLARTGILFPESVLESRFFAVFATFVAINTVIYVVLAVVKILPRPHLSDFLPGRNRRAQERSIFPDGTDRREALAGEEARV